MTTRKIFEFEELNPKRRKERAENWSEQEKLALLELIKIYGKPIVDKNAEKKDKDLSWEEIYHGMKMQGCRREKGKIKDMWKRMKMLAKSNHFLNKKTSIDMQVISLCPDVLVMDSSSVNIKHDPLSSETNEDRYSPASMHEEKSESLLHEVIVQNGVAVEQLRVTPDIDEKSFDLSEERVKQMMKHEDALFRLKFEHVQRMYEIELEQKRQKHKLEMEILFDVREKLRNTNVNLLDVINHLK